MKFFRLSKVSILTIFTSLALVNASRYCQCENERYGRIFPGIENTCGQLGNGWCATNCNRANTNCDYCQWVEGGPEPAAGYQALKTWCSSQTGYDSGSETSYKGSQVNCYSFQNKASCRTCGGCGYYDTPFYKRDEMSLITGVFSRQDDGQGSDADPNLAPDAFVTLQFTLVGIDLGGQMCGPIFSVAAADVAQQFLQIHSDPCLLVARGNGPEIRCDKLEVTFHGGQSDFVTDFTTLCGNYGGQSGAVDSQGNYLDPEDPSEPVN